MIEMLYNVLALESSFRASLCPLTPRPSPASTDDRAAASNLIRSPYKWPKMNPSMLYIWRMLGSEVYRLFGKNPAPPPPLSTYSPLAHHAAAKTEPPGPRSTLSPEASQKACSQSGEQAAAAQVALASDLQGSKVHEHCLLPPFLLSLARARAHGCSLW